jgi:3-phenylpropionate/trans-cinnamate dioxygenase ferredoxin reductase subunit
VEAQSRLMPRVVAPLVSEHYASLHTAHGVRLLPGRQVAALDPAVAALGVELSDGERLTADLVVVGIGVVPNSELAEMAGLACESGILVDEFSRTSDPSIVAAGDCTRHRNVRYPLPHRLESVQNAVDQANVAAASLLGAPLAYDQVPWFWSDQYDVKLQMVGLSGGYDRSVVRGSPAAGAFSVFYYAGERLIAVDSVNRPAEHMLARRLMTEGIDVGWDAAGDPGTDLKSLLPGG